MPIPAFPDLDNQQDPAKREQFVSWVLETLTSLVTNQDGDDDQLFVQGLRVAMNAAWNEAHAGFAELPAAAAALPLEQVRRHGLAGDQLAFKLATVRYWAGQFQDADQSPGFVLRRLLDAIDTLLDSLLAAIGVGSSLKELKDAVRDSLSD